MRKDIQNNMLMFISVICGIILFYNWKKTTKDLTTNKTILQGIDIVAGIVLTLSFVVMVYQQRKSNKREIKQRVLQLTLMNREYWMKIMTLFMKHSDELKYLADEIFLGMDFSEEGTINKTPKQKQMEFYVIEIMFQMLVDVYRIYDIDYLPQNDITGWSNTYIMLFSSKTVRNQWKHSRFLYGNSRVHDFIEKYGIIDNPKTKLLDEMRKSHMITMIRNKKMKVNDFENVEEKEYTFTDISKKDNNSTYLRGEYIL
jgi:hypothetical protein